MSHPLLSFLNRPQNSFGRSALTDGFGGSVDEVTAELLKHPSAAELEKAAKAADDSEDEGARSEG